MKNLIAPPLIISKLLLAQILVPFIFLYSAFNNDLFGQFEDEGYVDVSINEYYAHSDNYYVRTYIHFLTTDLNNP
jgi:hypothetical protein